jgi:hypothetical protein
MVRVEVSEGRASFIFGRFERFMTWKERLDVRLDHIVSVSTDVPPTSFIGEHRGGLSLGLALTFKVPFVPWGGQIRTQDLRHLLVAMRDPRRCITVGLVSEDFDALIFDVGDKARVAPLLRDASAAANR